ncbi:glucosamine--fructose-6-phosphate aminotransferase, isomerizing [Methanococcus aeolicus Nankai-3]|uniref:Glutamine--fructose-6-phosphate aminotransferase [isomerizing] n=1 Tax=Methanococcus aeolicus (strain ATCC BAA-1280 / DSM 17508 / OCM 812 / Nankai-3) TaxID=419665 RepID=A6UVU4_META3|nr:glutamine--fructose-6-phosphate transaminase (isomerizing) [Methanococcus aeolicus]ABR56616.1 glucosamine--fructose-6-phosphate aminotransferase, isomerizing [Methanococcus aeolicus Nankai-3]
MCGIIGYIGNQQASPILLNGLKRLEYRGYDSCGIGIIDNTNPNDINIIIKKNIGKVNEVSAKEDFSNMNGYVGISHDRWGTHGKITKENAHPHTDCNNNLCVVHNGIISNYAELKTILMDKGHKFKSETDTEIIPHLIEEELKKYDGPSENDYIYAIKEALKKIDGTYAILILNKNFPNMLVGVKNESPLIVGLKENEYFLGSDISAFLEWTKDIIPLEDGDIVILKKDDNNSDANGTGANLSYKIYNNDIDATNKREKITIEWDIESAEKGGYEHFMLKEIMEEPEIIKDSSKISTSEIKELAKEMKNYDKIYIVAMGTSLNASMVAEYWFSNHNKLIIPCDSSEFLVKGIIDENTLVIGITQSGETYDTIKALKYAKKQGAKTATIVNVLGSSATREADITIMMGSGIEISVCATKTYMSQLMILYRLFIEYGLVIGKDMSKYQQEMENIPNYIKEVIGEKERENIKRIAKNLTASNYLFISKGVNLPNSLEGALKFKEITYLHAEGMSSGFLKHGTISLIDENMDTVVLIPPTKSELFKSVLANIEEIKARNGKIIGVSPVESQNIENIIKVPDVMEEVSPFVYAPACQLLAYYKAVEMGRDVDKPRGLAKSVTVE